jgi:hypothetical protein
MVKVTTRYSMLVVAGLAVGWAGIAQAAKTEVQCLSALYKAAGAYANCEAKAQASFTTTGDTQKLLVASSKCRVKYAKNWPKLQKKFTGTGTTCDQDRFTVTATTVIDNLTALMWERKDNDCPGVHCVDTLYAWSNAQTTADGNAFTEFVSSLNTVACFEGQCDWRLPTRDELQTIVSDPYTGSRCTTAACIDPVFGPSQDSGYWSATSETGSDDNAWVVLFDSGGVGRDRKGINGDYARAVRGGR